MLKLLKYDLKRDLFTLLGGTAALVLALLAIEFGGRQIVLGANGMAVLSLVTYMVFGLLILMAACNAFRINIRSIGRRLVPLGSIQYVGASLLYALLLSAVLWVIGGLQLLYYNANGTLELLIQAGFVNIDWRSSVPLPLGVLLITLWGTLFLLTMLLLVMALMESIRFKGRALLVVVVVVVLSSMISAVENSFFGGPGVRSMTGVRIENQTQMTMPTESLGSSLPAFGFELVVGALFIWATVKLIDRKVRIE